MSQTNTSCTFDSLAQIYADVIGNARHDPIERILAITYEFDEQQLVNLVSTRLLSEEFELHKNYLRFIRELEPVVIYDARKTREFSQLPHFLDLVAVPSKPFSCHHSKAYLIVTEKTVRLAIGSMNLTQTGLFANREVFIDFTWSESAREELAVLHSFVGFLQNGYADCAQAVASPGLASLIHLLQARLQAWGEGNSVKNYTLLCSGYAHEPAGITALAALWRTVSAKPPTLVFAVSPFFDRSNSYFADLLREAVGNYQRLHLVTEENAVGLLSKRHFGKVPACQLGLVRCLADDAERQRIAAANDGAQLGDIQIERKLHAKILVLCAEDGQHLVYMGSANFTAKAWNGDNRELGLAWVEQGKADQLIKSTLNALALAENDAYLRLPDFPVDSTVEDDEGYRVLDGYPTFIERVELARIEGRDAVRFQFFGADLSGLGNYDVSWAGMPIMVNDGLSQAIPIDCFFDRLLGGKNLALSPHQTPELVFHIPFQHSADLVRQQDLNLFPDPEAWLMHYAQSRWYPGGGQGEQLPGEEGVEIPAASLTVDRDANTVIAMQRYLSLFGAVEKEFTQRASEICKLGDKAGREEACGRRIEQPLRTFAGILRRQDKGTEQKLGRVTACFRLGELALLCARLAAGLPTLHPLAAELGQALQPYIASNDAALRSYADFCIQYTKSNHARFV